MPRLDLANRKGLGPLRRGVREREDAMRDRLPPHQGLIRSATNWPVVGESAPRVTNAPWRIVVCGLVARPLDLSLEEVSTRPQETRVVDFHCVTRWSKYDMAFGGVSLNSVLEESEVRSEARYVRFIARSDRDHDTSLTLDDVRRLDPLIAFTIDGAPLPLEHGGPVRIVTTGKYGYKSLKWLERIELLEENKLGFWESGPGYHDNADPWAEERYVTGNIPPDLRARMIETRRIGGREILSVDFSGADLAGLDGGGASLRNCRFEGTDLTGADFRNANLSNAFLRGATLVNANFESADLEGADFAGANLTNANFTNASLFGASFGGGAGAVGADLSGAQITEAQTLRLVDAEQSYVRHKLDL